MYTERNKIRLVAVGDIMLGDSPKTIGYGIASVTTKEEPNYLFENVDTVDCEIFHGNLECVVSNIGIDKADANTLEMRASPEVIDELKKIGLNVLNVANNHINQHGLSAYNDTIDILLRKSIAVVGRKSSNPSQINSEPYSATINGVSVCILGYSMEPERYNPREVRYSLLSVADIVNDVEKVSLLHDHTIVSIHWGDEFSERPNKSIVEIAHKIIDAGASVILGHHPHVIQPIEIYKKKIIAYSLGNFVSDMLWSNKTRNGILLKIHITPNGVEIYDIMIAKMQKDTKLQINSDENNMVTITNDINDIPSCENNLKNAVRVNRTKCYWYMFKNIRKYNINILMQIILKVIKNIFR